MLELTPNAIFKFTKLSVCFVLSWPPSKSAQRQEIIIFHIKWWILWINSLLLTIPLLYAAYTDCQNILLFTKSLCLAVSCCQTSIKMLICKLMNKKMQLILDELEDHVRNAERREEEIFRRHLRNYGPIHASFIGASVLASIGVILGPLILPQALPTDAKYPFSIDGHPILDIIYVQQSISGIQVASLGAMDCQIAMMLWCIVVRLEYLGERLTKISNIKELSECIQEHQQILMKAQKIIHVSRYIVLTTIIMTTMSIILGGIHIVGNQPMIVKTQFTIIVVGFCGLLYMIAWPSDILIRSCQNIGSAIYESNWKKINYDKNILIIMQHSKSPIIIKIPGILPSLSLNYYAVFLSKAASYFTTLRMVLTKIEENFSS